MKLSDPIIDRALGAYLGLAVGDALGATVEFMTAREITATYGVHRELIGGGWLHLKPGQVTDDTQMSLALGEAILNSPGGWDLQKVAESFVTWMRSHPPDIGQTCRRGIRRYLLDGSLQAPPSEDSAGNGALMRNLPVILATLDYPAATHTRSLEQSRFTHHHPYSDAAVIALGDITRNWILGSEFTVGVMRAHDLARSYPLFRFRPWPGGTSGYVVDTVQTVFDAVINTDSFESCLVRAVNRGGDADTIGALAGQLAGALYGANGIPSRWLRRLDPKVVAAIHQQNTALLTLPAHANCAGIR